MREDVDRLPWIVRIIKISRLQFGALAAAAFFVGYLLTGRVQGWLMVLGVLVYFIDQAAGAMFNAVSDQAEDRENMPDFVAVCESVGYDRIRRISYGIKAVTFLGPLAVAPWYPVAVAIGCTASLFPALYSLGPRFKRSTLLSFISHGIYTSAPFLTGWTLGRGLEIPARILLITFLLGYAFAINRTIRGFPDIEGDKATGNSNFWTRLAESGRLRSWQMILISPHVLVAVLAGMGALELRFLWVTVLAAAALWLGYLLTIARQRTQRVAAWHWGIIYSMLVHAAILSAVLPAAEVWAAVGVMLLIRFVFSEFGLDYRPTLPMRTLWRITAETLANRGSAHA